MEDDFAVNERIKTLREHLGLGRSEFAKETGLKKDSLQNIEQKKQKVYTWQVQAIASRWPSYKVWLVFGETLPEVGQISPEIEDARRNLNAAG